jgi:hypothetical protein
LVGGLLKGAIDTEDLTNIGALIKDGKVIVKGAEQVIKDLQVGGFVAKINAVKELGELMSNLKIASEDFITSKKDL